MNGAVESVLLERADFRSVCDFGACVEVATVEVVAVRDSKSAGDGPVLWFSRAEWDEFVSGVKEGRFDVG
jgi:Domain of unknown function (DUF397)